MILRRLGNKKKIAMEIQKHFPPHKIYIEPFFGAGGMFFNKPKAKSNILNDLDSDVFNLFNILVLKKTELKALIKKMPLHKDLLNYWVENKETDDLLKALRFLFLSNFTFLGLGAQLSFTNRIPTKVLRNEIDKLDDILLDCQFNNDDFRKFIKNISMSEQRNIDNSFYYCDPPYLETNDNYSHSFTEQDSSDLFNSLEQTGCKFAYSEFDHPFILDQAKQRGLNVITIGERQNLKNRRIEILVTNYQKQQLTIF